MIERFELGFYGIGHDSRVGWLLTTHPGSAREANNQDEYIF